MIAEITESNAHISMQIGRQRDSHGKSQNGMGDRNGVDVSVSRESRRKAQATDQSREHENRIREVRDGKYDATREDATAASKYGQQVQEQEGLQYELLLERPDAVSDHVSRC